MDREDIFNIGRLVNDHYASLEGGTFSKFPEDNFIIKKYVDAKFQGNYRHLMYDCNSPAKTVYKNLVVLRKIMGQVDKPLIELTEEDIVELQNNLNQNKIFSDGTTTPISFAYKKDIVKTFKQFWAFYRAYAKYEEDNIVPHIAEYFRVRKDKNANLLVKFLTKQDIEKIVDYAHNLKMRALIKTFFETGARTIEILNVRKFNCSFDEHTQKWTIKLPNMKGISAAKMPIEIDYAHRDFDAWMKRNDFDDGDYIFDYSYDHFRIYLAEIGKKALGRHVTPKMFRKSCVMYLVNLDVNEQYIKSHMGWSASSKAIAHYINQRAIKKPDKLRSSFEIEPQDEIAELKMKLKQMETMMLQKFAEGF